MTEERLKEIEEFMEKGGIPIFDIGDLIQALRASEEENHRLKKNLSDAANEINCAGPIDHRIRILKQEFARDLNASEERVKKLEGGLRKCLETLTFEGIGQYDYMEGSQIYEDFRKASELATKLLSREA
jgi:DNA-binding transcriptional MerR regulator